jgi:phi LC3 family holin
MINWKVRFKNPTFLIQLFLTLFIPVLGYFGLTAQDLTTWGALFQLIKDALSNPYVLGTVAIGLWNAINDPTTKGIVSDSEQAKNYTEPK